MSFNHKITLIIVAVSIGLINASDNIPVEVIPVPQGVTIRRQKPIRKTLVSTPYTYPQRTGARGTYIGENIEPDVEPIDYLPSSVTIERGSGSRRAAKRTLPGRNVAMVDTLERPLKRNYPFDVERVLRRLSSSIKEIPSGPQRSKQELQYSLLNTLDQRLKRISPLIEDGRKIDAAFKALTPVERLNIINDFLGKIYPDDIPAPSNQIIAKYLPDIKDALNESIIDYASANGVTEQPLSVYDWDIRYFLKGARAVYETIIEEDNPSFRYIFMSAFLHVLVFKVYMEEFRYGVLKDFFRAYEQPPIQAVLAHVNVLEATDATSNGNYNPSNRSINLIYQVDKNNPQKTTSFPVLLHTIVHELYHAQQYALYIVISSAVEWGIKQGLVPSTSPIRTYNPEKQIYIPTNVAVGVTYPLSQGILWLSQQERLPQETITKTKSSTIPGMSSTTQDVPNPMRPYRNTIEFNSDIGALESMNRMMPQELDLLLKEYSRYERDLNTLFRTSEQHEGIIRYPSVELMNEYARTLLKSNNILIENIAQTSVPRMQDYTAILMDENLREMNNLVANLMANNTQLFIMHDSIRGQGANAKESTLEFIVANPEATKFIEDYFQLWLILYRDQREQEGQSLPDDSLLLAINSSAFIESSMRVIVRLDADFYSDIKQALSQIYRQADA